MNFLYSLTSLSALLITMAACDGDHCSTDADCAGSPASQQAGRCGPEVACVESTCRAECAAFVCKVVRQDENPCPNERICTQTAKTVGDEGRCTNKPISCRSTEDCPLYRPNANGDWSCDEGICRFPGHRYNWE